MDYLKDFSELKKADAEEQALRTQQDALIIDLHKMAKTSDSKELDNIAICLSGLHNFARESHRRRSVIYDKYCNFTNKITVSDSEVAVPNEDDNLFKILPRQDKLQKPKIEENKEDVTNLELLDEQCNMKEIIDLTEDKTSEYNIVDNDQSKHDSNMKMIKYNDDMQSPKLAVKELDLFEQKVEEHSKSYG